MTTDCPGGVGLTTALVALRGGWVIVGSTPTTDGTADTLGPGCLIVLDSHGNVRETFHGHGINGPWDMTATPGGAFVAVKTVDVSVQGGAGGDLFGLAVRPDGRAVYFVNDGNNMLYLLS